MNTLDAMTDLEILETFIVEKPVKSGMYLRMTHGRDHPDDELHDWGFDGPLIGPLNWVHVTYFSTVNIGVNYKGDSITLYDTVHIKEDLMVFKDKYYGDWSTEYLELKDTK